MDLSHRIRSLLGLGTAAALGLSLGTAGPFEPARAQGQTTITVGQGASLQTLDPDKTGQPTDEAVLVNLFDSLTRRARTGALVAGLALSWQSTSPTTWVFHLRRGVKFHDGEPFDARAVKFSLDRVLDPAFRSPIQEMRSYKEIKIVDPYTVQIETKYPDPLVPDNLALFGGLMVPSGYVHDKGDAYFAQHPVGTGPFLFEDWVKDDHITLRRNAAYWGGAPAVDRVIIRFIPDASDRVSALLAGQVDLIDQVPAAAVKAVTANPGTKMALARGIRIYYVSIANRTGPTADPRVRQALSYAVNTPLLIQKLLQGYGVPIGAPVADTSFGYEPSLRPYPYDVNRARALLREAGYAQGFSLEFDTTSLGNYQDIANAVAGMWEAAGVRTEIKTIPWPAYSTQYGGGTLGSTWNLGYTVWQGDPTVLIDTFFHSGRPRARFFSPQLDLLIEGEAREMNPALRLSALHRILETLHDQAPWIYLFQARDIYGMRRTVAWAPLLNQTLDMAKVTVAR